MAELFQVVASAVSIVDCSVRLAKFIKNLKDDARDIHDWLVEMKANIDTLHNILGFVKQLPRVRILNMLTTVLSNGFAL